MKYNKDNWWIEYMDYCEHCNSKCGEGHEGYLNDENDKDTIHLCKGCFNYFKQTDNLPPLDLSEWYVPETKKIDINHTITFNLDNISEYIFKYKGKEYKLNPEEFIKLLGNKNAI